MAELLRGVVRRQREIDPMVDNQLATGWRLARVDSIMRAILRAGVLELMERPDIPARVVITEYVDVARAFFDADEPKVVNGVLDKLGRKLRPKEFDGLPADCQGDLSLPGRRSGRALRRDPTRATDSPCRVSRARSTRPTQKLENRIARG